MNPLDITGNRSGRWTVISRAENTKTGQAQWLCRCDCGTEKILKSIIIRREISKSCGCFKLEGLKIRSTKHGHAPAGGASKTYNTWAAMVKRCTNPKNAAYKYYGGNGIEVCERWLDFNNFLSDMGQKPNGTSLDRINIDLGYSPENCRWATNLQQANNRRDNHFLTYNGETRTIAEWARLTGMHPATIATRIRAAERLNKQLSLTK